MSLTKPSDYKGSVRISQNGLDKSILQDYLTEKESEYLRELLGCELYDLYVADSVDGVPQNTPYTTIFNPLCLPSGDCKQGRSRGIKDMLIGFMYFEYVRDQHQINSSIGVSKSIGVASELLNPDNTMVKRIYNKSIIDYQVIQYYICQNIGDFPTYNGVKKEAISIL